MATRPTLAGWACLLALLAAPALFWFFRGETWLCLTDRKTADILVVEGWIGPAGVSAAADEYRKGQYRFVVATGQYGASGPDGRQWNYAEITAGALQQAGVPAEKIVRAPAAHTERQRTYEAAVAVHAALRGLGDGPRATLNVFTLGAHARRSRRVHANVLGAGFDVGVIAWTPSDYSALPWWKSSYRSKDLLVETTAWFFELLLKSGRHPNPTKEPVEAPARHQ